MRNPPLDGIKRQKLTVRDVRVLPLSYVDPDRNLWRSGGYQVWKTDRAMQYSPRDGSTTGIGTVRKARRVSFDPPGAPHFTNDWVLVLGSED